MAMYLSTLIKKRKHRADRTRGQSFWEWLLYKRFWDILPKSETAYITYWANFVLCFILIISIIVLSSFDMVDRFREILFSVQFVAIGGPLTVRFWSLGGYRKK
jgi:hypothetical protein